MADRNAGRSKLSRNQNFMMAAVAAVLAVVLLLYVSLIAGVIAGALAILFLVTAVRAEA